MKSLAVLIMALSLAGSCFISKALAAPEDGAKGLFFKQLDHPSANLNTGIQYWIELHHNGETIHATNKTAFHTGDKILIHVRPNIDGFAYIMLKSGSRGEQAVLFPSKGRDENNKITRGKEIVLPDDGMLSFDENPGTEKLTLLVSRKPIETKAYLSDTANSNDSVADKAPRLVAMSSSGSKDLIPNQVLVSYLPSSVGAPESVKTAAAAALKASKQTAAVGSKQQETTDQKTSPVAKASTSPSSPSIATTTEKARKARTSKNSHRRIARKGNTHQTIASADSRGRDAAAQSEKSSVKAGLVTVVFNNPDSVLAADISLEHL